MCVYIYIYPYDFPYHYFPWKVPDAVVGEARQKTPPRYPSPNWASAYLVRVKKTQSFGWVACEKMGISIGISIQNWDFYGGIYKELGFVWEHLS